MFWADWGRSAKNQRFCRTQLLSPRVRWHLFGSCGLDLSLGRTLAQIARFHWLNAQMNAWIQNRRMTWTRLGFAQARAWCKRLKYRSRRALCLNIRWNYYFELPFESVKGWVLLSFWNSLDPPLGFTLSPVVALSESYKFGKCHRRWQNQTRIQKGLGTLLLS